MRRGCVEGRTEGRIGAARTARKHGFDSGGRRAAKVSVAAQSSNLNDRRFMALPAMVLPAYFGRA